MTTARDIMHPDAQCVNEADTLVTAAQMMRQQGVGALPICGSDNRLRGIITDRDIVIKCIAAGFDPRAVTAGQLATDTLVWVEADADSEEVLRTMTDNRIKRIPVIDQQQLVGMISEADIAKHCDDKALAGFVHGVYEAPPNN